MQINAQSKEQTMRYLIVVSPPKRDQLESDTEKANTLWLGRKLGTFLPNSSKNIIISSFAPEAANLAATLYSGMMGTNSVDEYQHNRNFGHALHQGSAELILKTISQTQTYYDSVIAIIDSGVAQTVVKHYLDPALVETYVTDIKRFLLGWKELYATVIDMEEKSLNFLHADS